MDFVQPFQPVKCILDRWENYCMAHSSLDANNLVSKGWMFVGILPNKVGQNLDADCCGQNWKSYILFSWVMGFFLHDHGASTLFLEPLVAQWFLGSYNSLFGCFLVWFFGTFGPLVSSYTFSFQLAATFLELLGSSQTSVMHSQI